MFTRELQDHIKRVSAGFGVIAITGPRQAGKTTFAQTAFPQLPYENLESPFVRANASNDPLAFLAKFPRGAVLDEVQNAPELFSYLQVRIDAEAPGTSSWVLTGSHQLDMVSGVSQSLAGRALKLELLPFSHAELESSSRRPRTLADAVLRGGYPRLYDERLDLVPHVWLENYVMDVTQRDLRDIVDVRNRAAFDKVIRLCAARVGQTLNMSELARDVGVDHKTIASWIGALEACYIVRLVRPHFRNFGKRLVKQPKLYFLDSGLACRLLFIGDVNQLRTHPQWGSLVENWCVGEVLKSRIHRGLPPDLWFWRSSDQIEVDLVVEAGGGDLLPIEIKATATPNARDAASISKLRGLGLRDETTIRPGLVIYGGDTEYPMGNERFVPWHSIGSATRDLW